MVLPLAVLAVLSVVGGFMGWPHSSWIERWLEPVIPIHEAVASSGMPLELPLMGVSLGGAVIGIFVALKLYSNLLTAEGLKKRFSWLWKVLDHKWYVDEIYNAVIIRPIHLLSEVTWKGFDIGVIDRVVNGFGRASEWTGQTVRVIQTGSIQVYALALLIGVVATVGYLIYGMAG